MKKEINIASFLFSKDEIKLLKQIWRQDYPDCASLEEVTRRVALKGIKRELGIRKSFNVFKKMRNDGKSLNEIIQILKNREMDWEAIKKQADADGKTEADAGE